MLNQKKVKIFLVKFRKSPAKQFLEIAKNYFDTDLLFQKGEICPLK